MGDLVLKYAFLITLYLLIIWVFSRLVRSLEPYSPAPSRRMRGLVVLEQAPSLPAPAAYHLTDRLTIGRDSTNTIVLADSFVSAHHATVERRGGSIWLRDEGSTNGTFVNGERIREPVALQPGDQIAIGACLLRYTEEGLAAAGIPR